MAYFSRVHVNRVTGRIICAAIEVHRRLGPGLLESAYHACMVHELASDTIRFRSKVLLPLTYRGLELEEAYEVDLLVEELVVVELKATKDLAPVHEAQLLTYMKLTGAPIGLLVNFHVPLVRNGIRRLFNNEHEIVDDFDPQSRGRLEHRHITATRLPP